MTFEEFCQIHDIRVIYTKTPRRVKGLTYYDGDEFFIVINEQLGYGQALATLKHELLHVLRKHFDSDLPVEELEEDVRSVFSEYKFT